MMLQRVYDIVEERHMEFVKTAMLGFLGRTAMKSLGAAVRSPLQTANIYWTGEAAASQAKNISERVQRAAAEGAQSAHFVQN